MLVLEVLGPRSQEERRENELEVCVCVLGAGGIKVDLEPMSLHLNSGQTGTHFISHGLQLWRYGHHRPRHLLARGRGM